jgi:hypothetical protein
MKSTWDTVKTILPWLVTALTLLTLILGLFGKLGEAWHKFFRPLWEKAVRPLLKIVVAPATLVLPNAFIIGFLMHKVATYYFEAGSLEFVITNSRVFFSLVGWQALLVSLYSFLWALFVYPRVRRWFVGEKSYSRR